MRAQEAPTVTSSARRPLDLIADYVEARANGASDTILEQIAQDYFKAVQTLQAVLDDPYR